MSTEVRVFRHPDEFPDDVCRLFALGERESIELGADWYRNLLDTGLLEAGQARFHVLHRSGRALAALPLMTQARPWPRRSSLRSLSNYYTAVYAPVIDPELNARDLVPLIEAVKRTHAPLSSLRLQPMDPQSHGYPVLMKALRAAGLIAFDFHCFGNWFLRTEGGWKAYLEQRTSKLRSNIKRAEKKLVAEGASVEVLLAAADCERAIDAYQRVYAASWKQEEPFPGFVPGLIALCAQRGWLRLGIVWLRGRPIAAQLWMVANGKADIYKVAYDEAFKEYSPGTVLTARLMQHVIERDGVVEVDYLIGDDAYKKLWMNERRERRGMVAYDPRTIGGAIGAAREAAGRAVKPALLRWQNRQRAPSNA